MTDTPQLLDDLLRVPAPSGYEEPASAVWRKAAEDFAEVRTDGLGSSIAIVGDADAEPLFAIAGHMDEIGLVVTHIDDKGFIWFGTIGGWDPQILVGQRVEIVDESRARSRRRGPQAHPPSRGRPAQEGRRDQEASTSTSAPRMATPHASSCGLATPP